MPELTDNNEVIINITISVLIGVLTQFRLKTFLALERYVASFNLASYLQSTATQLHRSTKADTEKSYL